MLITSTISDVYFIDSSQCNGNPFYKISADNNIPRLELYLFVSLKDNYRTRLRKSKSPNNIKNR